MPSSSMLSILLLVVISAFTAFAEPPGRPYNSSYEGTNLNRVAFPLGGMGAGMVCLEGTGSLAQVSVRNRMEFFNEPCMFAALCVKRPEGNVARIIEGPVPDRKFFGNGRSGNGSEGTSYGLPRYDEAVFLARFPFAEIAFKDDEIPLETKLSAWSPFIPGDADNSSLPVAGLEYTFRNPTTAKLDAVFSFNSKNFMASEKAKNTIRTITNGFVLAQEALKDKPEAEGSFAAYVIGETATVDHCWFKGGWWDSLTLAWRNIQEATLRDNPPVDGACPGASLFVPFTLEPGQEKTIRLALAWYVPKTDIRIGNDPKDCKDSACCPNTTHAPWYSGKFDSVNSLAEFWTSQYTELREKSMLFRETFYDTSLPPEVVEAVAANLTILKSPTVQRQTDGRLWCYEGCGDNEGCCHGSCTHVWNYAQAMAHLFPDLERTLRETEFTVSQDERGHQTFRTSLPIRPVKHDFHAAADGQLGGIMKVYREWRVSGDTKWMRSLWPKVQESLNYCIKTWDPRGKGTLEEPHHNTYDIEYWGPDCHCTTFYLGALIAAIKMGEEAKADVTQYKDLLAKGRQFLETELYNGEYFFQKIQTEGLDAKFKPLDTSDNGSGYSDVVKLLNEQGPRYQYGTGCLSDGVLGLWIAQVCGIQDVVADPTKVKSHLASVYKYNLKHDLSAHSNPQRPSYALGNDGGLLLCSWPKGGALAIPFVYSDEVWTGIEYQVASHLIMAGMVNEGLDVVRVCRDRYDGIRRNPFDEYECGHWYARALSSYSLLQALTGVRYDAVDETLYLDSRVGDDFRVFLATGTGYGTAGLKAGKPFIETKSGKIRVKHWVISGKESDDSGKGDK